MLRSFSLVLLAAVLAHAAVAAPAPLSETDVVRMEGAMTALERLPAGSATGSASAFAPLARLPELLAQYRVAPALDTRLSALRERMYRLAAERTQAAVGRELGDGAAGAVDGLLRTGTSARAGNPLFKGLRSDLDATVVAQDVTSGGARVPVALRWSETFEQQFRSTFGVPAAAVDVHVYPGTQVLDVAQAKSPAELVASRARVRAVLQEAPGAYESKGALRYVSWYSGQTGSAEVFQRGKLVPDPQARATLDARGRIVAGPTERSRPLLDALDASDREFTTVDALGLATNESVMFGRASSGAGSAVDRLLRSAKHAARSADAAQMMLGQPPSAASDAAHALRDRVGLWQREIAGAVDQRAAQLHRPLAPREVDALSSRVLATRIAEEPALARWTAGRDTADAAGSLLTDLRGMTDRNLQLAFQRAARSTDRVLASTTGDPLAIQRAGRLWEFSESLERLQAEPGGTARARALMDGLPPELAESARWKSFTADLAREPAHRAAAVAQAESELARTRPAAPGETTRGGGTLLAVGVPVALSFVDGLFTARRADGSLDLRQATSFLTDTRFWRTTVGAAAGGWLGSKLVALLPDVPVGGPLLRAFLPLFAGIAGASLAGGGPRSVDWTSVTAQSIAGALGGALALLVAPAAPVLAPMVGELLGAWLGGRVLDRVRAARAGATSGIAASDARIPVITGPAGRGASDAYGRLLDSTRAGDSMGAKRAYHEYRRAKQREK